jgi:hypothetical protein
MLADSRLRIRGVLAWILALKTILMSSAFAVNIAVNISPSDAIPDPDYLGSLMAVENVPPAGFTASLSGENYGIDAEFPDLVWGLGVDQLPGNSRVYWIVDSGFQPSAAGSLTYDDGAGHVLPASWLSFKIDTGGRDTLFEDLTIELTGLEGVHTVNGWYGTSADDFAMAGELNLGTKATSLTLTLADILHTGLDAFEVRIYGLLGADIGGFKSLKVQGKATTVTPVPEPNALILIAAVVFAALVQRLRPR